MAQQTSLESYAQLKKEDLGNRQLIVLEAIQKNPDSTDLELCRRLGRMDPNFVRPRRKELLDMGFIRQSGTRQCTISKRKSMTWRLVT